MTTAHMRAALLEAYSGLKWRTRVNKMSDNQVIAVYRRLQQQGKVNS